MMNKKIIGIFLGIIFLISSFSNVSATNLDNYEKSEESSTLDKSGITIWIECYAYLAFMNPLHPDSYKATITITKENGEEIILPDNKSTIWYPCTKHFGIALPHGEYNVHCKIDSFLTPCEDDEDVIVNGHELVVFTFEVIRKPPIKNIPLKNNLILNLLNRYLLFNKFVRL